MHDIIVAFGSVPPVTMAMFIVLVIVVLLVMPKILVRLGVQKIGGIELNVTHDYEVQYGTAKQISDLDRALKERLWDWSEDLFLEAAEKSPLTCDMAIGHVLGGIFSHLRNIIMLNHLTDRLALDNEDEFYRKIKRGIRAVIRNTSTEASSIACPHIHDLAQLQDPNRYDPLIAVWLKHARAEVADVCRDKIAVYEESIKQSKTKYWRDVYEKCIEKNKSYIKEMG